VTPLEEAEKQDLHTLQIESTLTFFPSMTFLTSSMSCYTLEQLALALLIVLAVLTVGLASTSTIEETEAPAAPSPAPALPPSELTAGVAIGVKALEDTAGSETSTNNKSQYLHRQIRWRR
jgi:hypothetical protein